jgi:hypothetical protein
MWESEEFRGGRYRASLKHTACRSLYGYWDVLRAGRPAPYRRDVEPADIGPILSDTFILEAGNDAAYTYRLAGTRVGAYFGRELKGENWLAAWSPQDTESLSTILRSIVCEGAGAAIEFTGGNEREQTAPFETLLLPLMNRGNGYTRILGATLSLDEPYWLGSHPVVWLEITRLRLLWARDEPLRAGMGDERRFAADLPLRRHKHLALYDGGLSD